MPKYNRKTWVDEDGFYETWTNRDGSETNGNFYPLEEDDDDYDDDDESLSVYEAAEIWASNGKDEDYMFGYSEDELEDAL